MQIGQLFNLLRKKDRVSIQKSPPPACLVTYLKKLITYGSCEVFFSAAPTAQNSPELYFRFINSFIQSSLLRSLLLAFVKLGIHLKFILLLKKILSWFHLDYFKNCFVQILSRYYPNIIHVISKFYLDKVRIKRNGRVPYRLIMSQA